MRIKLPNLVLLFASILLASYDCAIERVTQLGCTIDIPCYTGAFFERFQDDGYYIFGYYTKEYASWICWGNPVTPIIALVLFVAAFIPWNLVINKVRVRS